MALLSEDMVWGPVVLASPEKVLDLPYLVLTPESAFYKILRWFTYLK
jgi:predicted transcriptional regulator